MSDDLPPGWTRAPLRELLANLDGRRVPVNAAERAARLAASSVRFPYYGATGQVGEIDDCLLEGEAILLGEDGAPFLDRRKRKAYLVDGKYWVNNHAHILRAREPFSNAFFCHQLNAIDYGPYVAGTTRLKLTQSAMNEIELVVAPEDEQRRIASKIDELFSRIDEGERALEHVQKLVERYRQSVLKAAVTGELTREWREKRKGQPGAPIETGEVLLARILQARREAWEKAEPAKMKAKGITPANDKWKQKYEAPSSLLGATALPKLPDEWIWAPLDVLADVVGGITVDQKRESAGMQAVPYLRVANVQRGYLDLSEVKSIKAPVDRIAQLKLEEGDVLFNEGGDRDKLGRGWIWESQLPLCIHQNHVFRARLFARGPWNKIVSWYGNVLGREWFMDKGKQTTNLASISLTKLKSLPLPLMSEEEAACIVSRVESVLSIADKQIEELSSQRDRSGSLRQAVLRSAFLGDLVAQDTQDKPAAHLGPRIEAARRDTPTPRVRRKRPTSGTAA